MKHNLVDEFIKMTQNQRLFPLLRNVSIFAFRLGGYIKKNYYKSSSSAPYIISAKQGESIAQLSETKLAAAGVEFFERSLNDSNFLIKHKKEINRRLKELKKIYKKCNYSYIKREKANNLAALARKVFSLNRYLNTLNWYTLYFDELFCKQLIKNSNLKISPKRLSHIYQKAAEPAFLSFDKRNYINYLDLIIKKYSSDKIAETCQYFYAYYSSIEGNLKNVIRKLKKDFGELSPKQANKLRLVELDKIKFNKKEFKLFLASLNSDEKKIADYIQYLMWVRDIRKTAVSLALAIIYRIGQRFFYQLGLEESLLNFYSSDEVGKGLDYLLKNKDLLKKRTQGFTMLYIVDDNHEPKTEYDTYEYTKQQLELNSKISKPKQHKIIKGQVAYQGKVRGYVKVIFDPSKIKKFKGGDILVTGMTRPEFISLMKKAAAIITDEGGIACHAAIVSREFKIPCIVGTRKATQILKNGDLVEVDARKGIVKIIKKA